MRRRHAPPLGAGVRTCSCDCAPSSSAATPFADTLSRLSSVVSSRSLRLHAALASSLRRLSIRSSARSRDAASDANSSRCRSACDVLARGQM